jgi:hypothetical protein
MLCEKTKKSDFKVGRFVSNAMSVYFCVKPSDAKALQECVESTQAFKPDQSEIDETLEEQRRCFEQQTPPKGLQAFYDGSYDPKYNRVGLHAAYHTVYQANIISRHERRYGGSYQAYEKICLVGSFDATIEQVEQGVVAASWKTQLYVYRRVHSSFYCHSTEVYYGLGWKDAVLCTKFPIDVESLPEPEPELFFRNDHECDAGYYYGDNFDSLERFPRSSHRAKTCTMLFSGNADLNKIMPTPFRVLRFLAGPAIKHLFDKTHRLADLCAMLLPNWWTPNHKHLDLLRLAAKEPRLSQRREVQAYFKKHPGLEVERLDETSADKFCEFKTHLVREIKVQTFDLKDVKYLLALLDQSCKFVVQKRYRFRREHHDVPRGFEITERPRGKHLCVAQRMRHPRIGWSKQSNASRFTLNYKYLARKSKHYYHQRYKYDRSAEHQLDEQDIQDAMNAMVDADLDEQRQAQQDFKKELEDYRDLIEHHVVSMLINAKLYDNIKFDDVVVATKKRVVDVGQEYHTESLAAKVEDVLDELGFVGTHKVYCFYNEMFLEANQEKEEEEEEEEQEDEEEDQQDEQQEEEDQQDEQQEEEDQQDEQQEEEDQQDEQQENQRAAHDDNYYYVSKADANVPSKNGVCMVS